MQVNKDWAMRETRRLLENAKGNLKTHLALKSLGCPVSADHETHLRTRIATYEADLQADLNASKGMTEI